MKESEDKRGKWIIIYGDMFDGFSGAVGPFEQKEKADEYLEDNNIAGYGHKPLMGHYDARVFALEEPKIPYCLFWQKKETIWEDERGVNPHAVRKTINYTNHNKSFLSREGLFDYFNYKLCGNVEIVNIKAQKNKKLVGIYGVEDGHVYEVSDDDYRTVEKLSTATPCIARGMREQGYTFVQALKQYYKINA